jgi:putative transposase
LFLEFRAYGKSQQFIAIEEAIRTVQFIRNKCIRLWMDNPKINKYDLSKYSAVLAKEFLFANKLNAMSRQASAERAWAAISRFFDNCKKKVAGKKGFPSFRLSKKTTVRLSIKLNHGSLRMTVNQSHSPIKMALAD